MVPPYTGPNFKNILKIIREQGVCSWLFLARRRGEGNGLPWGLHRSAVVFYFAFNKLVVFASPCRPMQAQECSAQECFPV